MPEPVFFTAPWDKKLTFLTLLICSILIGSVALLVVLYFHRPPPDPAKIVLLASVILPLVSLALAAALAPRGYSINSEFLRVERWMCPLEIKLSGIRSVEEIPPDRLRVTIRVLGSGGLFGYYGRFRNAALGSFRMYATRSRGYVMVSGEQKYVLTPEDPERFISTLNEHRRPYLRS